MARFTVDHLVQFVGGVLVLCLAALIVMFVIWVGMVLFG